MVFETIKSDFIPLSEHTHKLHKMRDHTFSTRNYNTPFLPHVQPHLCMCASKFVFFFLFFLYFFIFRYRKARPDQHLGFLVYFP